MLHNYWNVSKLFLRPEGAIKNQMGFILSLQVKWANIWNFLFCTKQKKSLEMEEKQHYGKLPWELNRIKDGEIEIKFFFFLKNLILKSVFQ